MTDINYNDGNWHGWNGGECPVHLRSEVEVVWLYNYGDISKRTSMAGDTAFTGNEHGDVIAFRVVKEYREPREWWANVHHNGDIFPYTTRDEANRYAARDRIECIKVREVLDNE